MELPLLSRAQKIMPGGVSSPVRALKSVGGNPLFIASAKGARLTDTNNTSYIDLCMSFGPLILGHAHPQVIETIITTAAKGTSFGTSSPLEIELAEKIIDQHDFVEWVRFVNSGTEAVMSAIRLARGITKRDLVIKFAGCYHGHADSMLVNAGSGLATFGISSSAGVPTSISKDTIVLELNNIPQLEAVFEKYGENIACTIIEGIPANNGLLVQSQEFMKQLEQTTKKYGALFILDEVITGFRLGPGGATDYYGLHPDLVTLGKVIGGGLPVGAYGGKKEYMEYIAPLGPVYQAGTLSGNPLAMAAGNITLDIIKQENVYSKLNNLGLYFEKSVKDLFSQNGRPLTLVRVGSILWMILEETEYPLRPEEISQTSVSSFATLHKNALLEGIYLPPSAYEVEFLSTAHTVEIIDELVTGLERSLKR